MQLQGLQHVRKPGSALVIFTLLSLPLTPRRLFVKIRRKNKKNFHSPVFTFSGIILIQFVIPGLTQNPALFYPALSGVAFTEITAFEAVNAV